MFFVMILTWFIFENFGGAKLKSDTSGTIEAFYVLFIVFTCSMVVLIIRDWISDVKVEMTMGYGKDDVMTHDTSVYIPCF